MPTVARSETFYFIDVAFLTTTDCEFNINIPSTMYSLVSYNCRQVIGGSQPTVNNQLNVLWKKKIDLT